jgi:hypothetical protein
MNTDMTNKQTTVRIDKTTPDEAALLRVLTPAEKLAALIEAAKQKAARLSK